MVPVSMIEIVVQEGTGKNLRHRPSYLIHVAALHCSMRNVHWLQAFFDVLYDYYSCKWKRCFFE
jgi:hypothetical protein